MAKRGCAFRSLRVVRSFDIFCGRMKYMAKRGFAFPFSSPSTFSLSLLVDANNNHDSLDGELHLRTTSLKVDKI
jgi:hypothetical protein